MKTLFTTILFVFTGALLAEPVWQYVPDMGNLEGILSTDEGLVSLDNQGKVLRTSNGETWEEVTRLGEPEGNFSIRKVLHLEEGLAVLSQGQNAVEGIVEPENWYRLYTTVNGLDWDVAIETGDQGEVAGPGLSDPYWYADGWIIYSFGAAPAVIWHSTDGLLWTEAYSSETALIQEGVFSSGGLLCLRLQDGETWEWVSSADGLIWNELAGENPSRIIEVNGIYVGFIKSPVASGVLYYSEDGMNWKRVGNPTGSRIGQNLYYTAGTFFFIQNKDQVHVSSNGHDWTRATFPEGLFSNWIVPRKSAIFHDERGFWYQVSEARPPQDEGIPEQSEYFFSQDGLIWDRVDATGFPEESVDPVLLPMDNLNYSPPPGPAGNPNEVDPLVEKEIKLGDYSLKIEYLPTERKVGLFLAHADGTYEVVNSSFGSSNTSYPYFQPVTIAAANGCFFALNEIGYLGVLDLIHDYLPQPLGLRASIGKYDDHIELSWDPVPNAASYRIVRSRIDDPESTFDLAVVEEAGFIDTIDLEINQVYAYQVQSLGGEQYSWLSSTVNGRLWSMLMDHNLMIPEIDYINYGVGYPYDSSIELSRADTTFYPWIYTTSHGWLYCCESPGNLWLWDPELGWLWTRNAYYPNLFLASEKQWLLFLVKADDTRWFFRYSDGSYISVD